MNGVNRFSLSPGFTVKEFCNFSKNFLCGFQEKLKQDSELNWYHMPTTSSTAIFKREKNKNKPAIIFSSKSVFDLSKKDVKNKFGLRFEAAHMETDLCSSCQLVVLLLLLFEGLGAEGCGRN